MDAQIVRAGGSGGRNDLEGSESAAKSSDEAWICGNAKADNPARRNPLVPEPRRRAWSLSRARARARRVALGEARLASRSRCAGRKRDGLSAGARNAQGSTRASGISTGLSKVAQGTLLFALGKQDGGGEVAWRRTQNGDAVHRTARHGRGLVRLGIGKRCEHSATVRITGPKRRPVTTLRGVQTTKARSATSLSATSMARWAERWRREGVKS